MRGIVWTVALAVLLSGCAAAPRAVQTVEEDAVLLTVDGREIPAWRYFCWLDKSLDAPEAPSAETLKDRALADTVLYAAVEDMAAEYGLTLSEEETAALTPGIWEELETAQWREMAAVGALYGKLCAMEVPQETLAAFAREKGYKTVKRILLPPGEGEEAARVFARLNGGGEPAFDAVRAERGETEPPRTFRPGDGAFPPELEAAAAGMEAGQLSGILETEEGFSILYCEETDLSGILIPWVDSCLSGRLAASDVQVLPGYEKLDISARIPRKFSKNGQDF